MDENTAPKFTPLIRPEALFHKRVSAFTIDIIAILLSTKLLVLSYSLFIKNFAYPLAYSLRFELPRLEAYLDAITLLGLYGCYFFLSIYLSQGKTLGKSLLGLRVISKEQPGVIEWWQALSRTIGYYACYFSGLVLFLLPLTNRSQFGLSDWISSTQVISEKQWEEMQAFKNTQVDRYHGLELLIHGYDESETREQKAA